MMNHHNVTDDLLKLTAQIAQIDPDLVAHGLLGGESGYGAYWENSVFLMHPFCWCDQPDCAWCAPCTCPDDVVEYFVDDQRVSFRDWMAAPRSRKHMVEVKSRLCPTCRGERQRAPNFLYKPTGMTVYWYKYIGRDTQVHGTAPHDWLDRCLASLTREPYQEPHWQSWY